jgi:hypothetical protein
MVKLQVILDQKSLFLETDGEKVIMKSLLPSSISKMECTFLQLVLEK